MKNTQNLFKKMDSNALCKQNGVLLGIQKMSLLLSECLRVWNESEENDIKKL